MVMKRRKFLGVNYIKTIKHILVTHIALLAFFSGIVYALAVEEDGTQIETNEAVECTQEVKLCSDGSSVGRVAPDCEFSLCPDEVVEDVATSTEATEVTATPVEILELGRVLDAKAQERIINLTANLSNKTDAIIARSFQIVERAESRLEKTNATATEEIETDLARIQLQTARQAIDEASLMMSQIDSTVISAVTSDKPLTNWESVKNIFTSTQSYLHEAKASIELGLAILSGEKVEVTEIQTEDQAEVVATSTDEEIDEEIDEEVVSQ
jgi:hypothetical protein